MFGVGVFLLVVLGFTSAYLGRKADIDKWNNGVCRKTNLPWVRIEDTEEPKGRFYTDGQGNYLFINWWSVDEF